MGQSPVPLATATVTPTVANNKQPSDSENTDEDLIGKGKLVNRVEKNFFFKFLFYLSGLYFFLVEKSQYEIGEDETDDEEMKMRRKEEEEEDLKRKKEEEEKAAEMKKQQDRARPVSSTPVPGNFLLLLLVLIFMKLKKA